MSLTTELLTVLDNNEEPLQKRLCIANNVFNSNELLALNKESLILEWITKCGDAENTLEIWKTLNACLSEQHMQTLRPNDIKINVLDNITATIIKHLNESNEHKTELLQCATIILKNELFQHYFKHDTKRFCCFIATFLLNINDVNELHEIFKIYLLFNKQIYVNSAYTENYLKHVLSALIDLLIKFDDNILFDNCVKLTQRVLFEFATKKFDKFIHSIFNKKDEEKEETINVIIRTLEKMYESDGQKACFAFKLIFVAFMKVHKTNTIQIYQFFVLIVRYVGFKIDHQMNINLPESEIKYDLNVSLNILAEILEIISKENISINDPINEITFSNFLISLLLSIFHIHSKPCLSILKIIKSLIIIDPVIITTTITKILVFLCYVKNDETKTYHSQLMISLFEMYMKLHRLHKFCSELLKSIHDGLFSIEQPVKHVNFKFSAKTKQTNKEFVSCVHDIFPENVVSYFQECITLQSNKQIISIMRTFITNLNEILENLTDYTEERKMLYVQIVSDLTCHFLSAVRIAEHTTTEITIDKFFKDINDFKEFLKKFGSALLKMEHNQNLMFSFLNLCYNWGENAILLNYYIPNNKSLIDGSITLDNSVNNLTYLHIYLSTDQWSLVSQRIKNFGEQPCKRILQKLIIQKLRAILLFEPDINESLETSVIANYSSNLETCWDIIFTERFITSKFFLKMETSQLISLADLIINDILTKSNFKLLANKNIIDSRDLVQSILYVCLSKINNLFKRKRRHSDASSTKPLNREIFEYIDLDSFVRNESINIGKLMELFKKYETRLVKVDEERFCNLMEIIKNIPVYSLSHEIQTTLFLFLLSICLQTQDKCKELCEKYLIGLVENTSSANILNNAHADILMRTIIENTQHYKQILNFCVNKTLKQNESIAAFRVCLNLLLKNISNERYLDVALISFHGINKATKYKISEENKDNLRKFKEKLCKHLFDVVLQQDDKIEAFVLVFQKYLLLKDKEDEEKLNKLLSILNNYIDYTLKNINETNAKGCLLLYELVLTNKTNIKDIPSDFMISVWKCCKDLKKNEDYSLNFDKTITLLFEHISIEQFPIILEDLLKSMAIYLKNNELDKITNQFGIWSNLINSSINSSKLKLCHNSLQSMLEEIMLYLINNNDNNNNNNNLADFSREYVQLQINIMENKQIPQLSNIIDIYLQTSQIIISKKYSSQDEFTDAFDTSFALLESFFKHRKILIIDRLPAYLVQLRNFIYHLSNRSNSDVTLSRAQILKIANCAFRIEQLVKNICSLKKDVARVAPYLIADILKHYETVTLYPEVKNHFNNCLNCLIDLCDSHAVSYLLRVLSTASREIFKNMHDNYKKYYKFTGKV